MPDLREDRRAGLERNRDLAGVNDLGNAQQLTVTGSMPYENGSTGWRVSYRNNTGANVTGQIKIYVVCATMQ